MFRVIIRPSNELTQDYLLPSALRDPVALTGLGTVFKHKYGLFHLPTLMHNSLFINSMYVTLLSSTCFEH